MNSTLQCTDFNVAKCDGVIQEKTVCKFLAPPTNPSQKAFKVNSGPDCLRHTVSKFDFFVVSQIGIGIICLMAGA
jgi:hypothetical protein